MADIGPNDALRFGLELAALGALGYWGWVANAGPARVVLAIGLPLAAAVLWGAFRVPGDPGPAPVAVPGPLRLGLEAALFGIAAGALAAAGRPVWAAGFGLLVLGHYVSARDRVERLWEGGTR